MTSKRMWPIRPLFEYAARIGVPGTALQVTRHAKKLTDDEADAKACQLGVHPSLIWPDWFEPALTELDRDFINNGWRPAWLYNERRGAA